MTGPDDLHALHGTHTLACLAWSADLWSCDCCPEPAPPAWGTDTPTTRAIEDTFGGDAA